IYVTHMDETIAVGSRHIVVDLRDYEAGTLGGGQRGVHANAETAKAMGIWSGHFNQSDINRHGTAFEELFDFAEVDGHVVRAAIVNSLPHIQTDEHSIVPEASRHLRSNIRSATHSHHVHDFDVADMRAASHQSLDQRFRFRAAWLDVHPHPG